VLANGQSFALAVETIWQQVKTRGNENLLAIGINCINPQHVTPLFESVKVKVPLVVYPNSGETYSVEEGWKGKNDCIPLEDYVAEWIGLGALFIGGCCRTNAKDIQRIRCAIESL